MREQTALVISIILLLVAVFAYPVMGFKLREAFMVVKPTAEEYNNLVRENIALKTAVALRAQMPEVLRAQGNSVYAFVYSRYPFNVKNELLVDAGRARGVAEGDMALIPYDAPARTEPKIQGSFLGVVKEVREATSIVQTIFDARFERAVRIGSEGVDALISGGNEPRVTLIPKRASVEKGTIVYAASPDLPYGIPIGTLEEIVPSSDALFREAKLSLGYEANEIKVLRIVSAGKR